MLPLHHGEGGVWALVNALIKKGDTEERSYHCLVSNDVGFNRSSTTVIVYGMLILFIKGHGHSLEGPYNYLFHVMSS